MIKPKPAHKNDFIPSGRGDITAVELLGKFDIKEKQLVYQTAIAVHYGEQGTITPIIFQARLCSKNINFASFYSLN